MAKRYFRPGTFAEEIDRTDAAIQAASTAVGAAMGVTRKGPVNAVMGPLYSLDEWENIYGGPESTYKQWYQVRAFFENGGQQLYYNRIAHYSSLTVPTRTGTVSSRSFNTADGGATAAFYDATLQVAPFDLEPGWTIVIDTDNNGAETVTFDAAAATVTCGNAETYNFTGGGQTLTVEIDGGATQTVTFQVGDFVAPAAATAEEVVIAMNAALVGCNCTGTTDVTITSDTKGTGSYVQVTGGTANAILNFSTALNQGTGDVANIDAVTYAEAKTVIEADTTGLTVSQLGSGGLRLTSDTTGAASEVDVQSGTGMAALGFGAGTATGSASSVDATLKLEFGWRGYDSPGTEPNGHLKTKVYKNPLHPSAGAGSDLAVDTGASAVVAQLNNIEGLEAGSIIKISGGGNTEYRQLTKVESVIESGALKHKVHWTTALSNSYVTGTCAIESREFSIDVYWDDELEEEWDGLNMLDTHNQYVETVINDEATGSLYLKATDLDSALGLGADIPTDDTDPTVMSVAGASELVGLANTDYMGNEANKLGVHAFDDVDLLIDQIAMPGYSDPTACHYMSQWCSARLFIYPTFAAPLGYTRAQVATWRTATFGLYSKYGCLEWCGLKVYDPESSATVPTITVTPEMHVMGLRARVDALPGKNDGGVWSSAAGEGQFGQLYDVIDMEIDINNPDQVVLNPLGVNCIRKFKGKIYRYSARTLDSDLDWRYENVTRFFMFLEKTIVTGTRWAVLRNNNFRLWRKLEDRVNEFMEVLMENNAFPNETRAENWFVKVGVDKGTMDQADIDNGRVIGQIGVAANKPGEFIVWQFTQYKSGAFAVESF